MAKGKVKVRRLKEPKKNRKKLEKGAIYEVATEVIITEVGDGMVDLETVHSVLVDDGIMGHGGFTWVGLEAEVAEAFVGAMEDAGLGDMQTFSSGKFGHVADNWEAITDFLKTINQMARAKAAELDL